MEQVFKNGCYAFYIYEKENVKDNPNVQSKYLLFKGIGNIVDDKVILNHKHDYLTTQYGFNKLRNYFDMKLLFGEYPCVVVDENMKIIDEYKYNSQDEIAEKYKIKVSRLQRKAFDEGDTLKKARKIKLPDKTKKRVA